MVTEFESMEDPVLIKVRASDSSLQLINQYPDLGLDSILAEEIEEIALLGRAALRSKVPIKTGELRNDDIRISNSGPYKAEVYIAQIPHTSSKGKNLPLADALAALLDKRGYRRSRTSYTEDGFTAESGSTAGWIEKALGEFDRRL